MHTLATRDGVDVGILESAQVALVSLVGEIGASDAHAGHTATFIHDVGAYGCVEQTIGWCGGFGVISFVEVVLLKVVIHPKRDKRVVQHAAVVQDFPLDVALPPRCRGERQVLALLGLVQLYRIDQTEAGAKMQKMPGMDVYGSLPAQQLRIAAIIAISHEFVIDDLSRTMDEDIIVDAIAE